MIDECDLVYWEISKDKIMSEFELSEILLKDD